MSKGIIQYGFFKKSLIIHLKDQAKFLEAIALKRYFNRIKDYLNIIIYFENVNIIDSTFIGTLLYMGMKNKNKNSKKGIIYCNNYIKDTIIKYGIDRIYDIFTEVKNFEQVLFNTVNIKNPDEKEMLKEIIENHKLLSSFSNENKKEFENLLKILETEYKEKYGNK